MLRLTWDQVPVGVWFRWEYLDCQCRYMVVSRRSTGVTMKCETVPPCRRHVSASWHCPMETVLRDAPNSFALIDPLANALEETFG